MIIASGLQILGIVASGSWYFWDANLSFGMIGGFNLASWGTLGRFCNTGEHNKGHFEVQAWISIDFWWILLPMVVIWLLGASTLASWGTLGKILGRSWDDPGTLEGTRKDPARSRLGFYQFFDDLGVPF